MRGNSYMPEGWSTRSKFKGMGFQPHVYFFPNMAAKKRFRVMRKVNGVLKTFGYFKTRYEANQYARACFGK